MTYEEFKMAWVDKEVKEYVERQPWRPRHTQAPQPVVDLCSRMFDWVFPVEMKETYEMNLVNGSLQKRCGL